MNNVVDCLKGFGKVVALIVVIVFTALAVSIAFTWLLIGIFSAIDFVVVLAIDALDALIK